MHAAWTVGRGEGSVDRAHGQFISTRRASLGAVTGPCAVLVQLMRNYEPW